jgi:serine/threonine protein kinase
LLNIQPLPSGGRELIAKITDFGLAVHHMGSPAGGKMVDNPRWLAPEIIRGEEYTEKVDQYSWAMVCWEMLSHKEPFHEIKAWAEVERRVLQGEHPIIPASCPPGLAAMIMTCWDPDPSKRPFFSEIVGALRRL